VKDRRPTSFDIAYRAGVSQSTVSRALRDSPQVSLATREKIQAIAQELNYRVDKNATALRSQSSNTLALLIFEDETGDDSHINPFFLSLLGNITRLVSDRGYDLLVSFQRMEQDWHLEYELSSKADGLILLGYGDDYTDYHNRLERLANAGAHLILWGPSLADIPVPTVGTDNELGGYLITQHLIELGHQSFTFIGNIHADSPEFAARYQGYSRAIAAAGLSLDEQLQCDSNNTEASAQAAAEKLLQKNTQSTAIVCASDYIALVVMRVLRSAGLRIPQDVAVTGFDDMALAALSDPPLSTVRQDTFKSSQLLVDNLLDQLKADLSSDDLEPVPETDHTTVQPTLIIRGSTAAPRSA